MLASTKSNLTAKVTKPSHEDVASALLPFISNCVTLFGAFIVLSSALCLAEALSYVADGLWPGGLMLDSEWRRFADTPPN